MHTFVQDTDGWLAAVPLTPLWGHRSEQSFMW